ncbi:MAG: glycosyltransferase family 39 protein [Bacteroidota bacterium]
MQSSYLHGWDEAFHGLVAKNMGNNPFYPVLYKKTFFVHGPDWYDTTIWLHKQPWFLWQMALSIKLLGASAFAVRLPSLIYMCVGIYFVYDIGKKIATERIGFYAALFYCLNNYMNEQLSGSIATDHNDVVFITLILAGIWAFVKHTIEPDKLKYVILIGVFCGTAILTKWLVALIILFCWFWYIVLNNKKEFYRIKLYVSFFKSFFIALAIALPWQIYISLRFPVESKNEYALNGKHMFEAIEGHSGDRYYYYDGLIQQYGYLSPLFCLLGIVLLHKYIRQKSMYYALLISFVFVYVFFTFVVTKMHGFTLPVSFFVFLGFGAIAHRFNEKIAANNRFAGKFLFTILALVFGFISFNLEAIQARHTNWKTAQQGTFWTESESELKEICDYINVTEKDTGYVYFNCDFPGNISFMFETNFVGYARLPSDYDVKTIKDKGYKIAILNRGILPVEIENNKEFKIISIDKFKVIKRDTCYLKSLKFGHFSNDNNKLTCNTNKAKFIFTYFKDGSVQIKTENNSLARIAYEYGGLILLDGTKYYVNERFRFEAITPTVFKIRTSENKYLRSNENGERVITSKFEDSDDFKFMLSQD